MGKEDHRCRQQLGGGLRLLAKLGGALTHKTILQCMSGGEGRGGAYNMLTHRHYSCILTRAHVGSKNYVQRELKPPQPPCLHPDP